MKTLKNGELWYDTQGNVIHAHGGCMLKKDGYYYWYGENRNDDNYISCYRSADLREWEFRRHILTTHSPVSKSRVKASLTLVNEKGGKVNLERPKVLYNAATKKYVLWVHYENGENYREAACAVATCDVPDGDFVYHGHFNPFGYMSRDCTLFQEEDGTAYFISAARDNADLHIYRLQEDYLNIDSLVNRLWQGEYREAPAVFQRNGTYYMLTSFCTGWKPNQGKYGTAESMDGKWSILKEFGDETTFHTQPAFVMPIGSPDNREFLYISDRWDEEDYNHSSYVFLKLTFDAEGGLHLEYDENVPLEGRKGRKEKGIDDGEASGNS